MPCSAPKLAPIFRHWLPAIGLLLGIAAAVIPGSRAAAMADDTVKPFEFRRLIINTAGAAPEACFRFSRDLNPASEAHYGDYLKVEPALKVDVEVTGKDLCIGGVDYASTYKVTLLKGLPARDGTRLQDPETVEVALNDRPSLVSVSGTGYVLSRDTAPGVTIQTVNVNRVRIHVLRLSDKLLTSSLTQTRWNRLSMSATSMNRWTLRDLLSDAASVIWSGTMDIAQDHNRTVFTAFPLTGIAKPGRNGIYLVVAENDASHMPEKFFSDQSGEYDDSWGESYSSIPAHWVMSTDMALTSLQGSDGLHVFVRSLSTAMPIAKVDIRLIATGQDVLGKLSSGKDGQVVFPPGLLRGTRANKAASVIAYGPGGDFSVLDLNRPAFDLSDRGVSGRPSPGPLEAYTYADRGIYRPGEIVHLVTLLRDRADNAVSSTPLTLVLRRPDGVEAKRFHLGPQPQGGFQQDVALTRSAGRGVWTVDVLVDPSSPPVGHAEFDVEDFVPQQLKVTLTSTLQSLQPNGKLTAALNGIFLYGAPAAELKSEANLRYVPDPAPVADATDYHFGLWNEQAKPAEQSLAIDDADAAGNVTITAPVTDLPDTSLPLKAVLSAGLFEPSGRYVGTTLELPVHNHPLLLGIKPLFEDFGPDDQHPARFLIRAFDATGKPVAVKKLHWNLVREDEVFDWFSEGGGGWDWHFHIVDHPVEDGDVDVAADKPLAFSHDVDWGGYRLIISDADNTVSTSVHFRAGWMSAAEAQATPDKLKIQIEKPILAVGETTHIQIKSQFSGRAEVVIAGDRVFATREIAVSKDGASFDVKGAADWGSGAYVLVSFYRPLNEGRAHDPVRAIAVAWLGIDPKPRSLSVAVTAPAKVTPRQSVMVPIKITSLAAAPAGAGKIYVTLSAVDEGILQLTRFRTPDPTGFFMGKRRLGVDIRDLYGELMQSDAERGAPHQGGDSGDLGGPGLAVESTRTVAPFSGVVALGSDGTAQIPIAVPDFEGQLRLMAVAYNGSQTGAGEATLIVRDPVIADVALPRFLAPGDTARLALSIHNTDGTAGAYHLDVAADGPAKITADHKLDYTLPLGKRLADFVTIAASDSGVSTIRADLTGPAGYKVHREWQIAVRSPHYPITTQTVTEQKPGESYKLDPALSAGLLPGSVTVGLGYSGNAGIDVPSLLQSLWTYPYGCTEQTTSTAFPLLYFNDPALLGRNRDVAAIKNRVQDAIDTIVDRQDASGQFGLWQAGDDEASPWLNVYAIDFLMRARETGFAVPEAALRRAYAWLQLAVRRIENDNDNSGYYAQAPATTLAYAEYVLARAGHADIGLLRRLHDTMIWKNARGEQATAMTPDHKGLIVWSAYRGGDENVVEPIALAHLAGAFALLGDHARANDSLQLAIANIGIDDYPNWWFDSAFYSENRDIAALIAIEAEIGDADLAAALVTRLNAKHVPVDLLSTQDKAWLLMAAHALNQTGLTAHLEINGKPQEGKIPVALSPDLATIGAGYAVTNKGDKPLWRSLTVTGTPIQSPAAIAQGYQITKEIYTLAGDAADPAELRQNDRLVVILHGTVGDNGDHRTVVVDPLPAGWEIEKTLRPGAKSANEDFGFVGLLTRTRIMEARDDRFVAAFDIGSQWQYERFRSSNDDETKLDDNEFRVAYLVRVVTPGKFVLPEAVVQDMYRPAVMGRTDAGQTSVVPR